MLRVYTKILPRAFLVLEKKILPYMDMAAIVFNGAKPFEQLGNTLLTECPKKNLVKIPPAVSEKKTFKDYTILYMYIAQGQGQITLRGQSLIVTKMFYYFYHSL